MVIRARAAAVVAFLGTCVLVACSSQSTVGTGTGSEIMPTSVASDAGCDGAGCSSRRVPTVNGSCLDPMLGSCSTPTKLETVQECLLACEPAYTTCLAPFVAQEKACLALCATQECRPDACGISVCMGEESCSAPRSDCQRKCLPIPSSCTAMPVPTTKGAFCTCPEGSTPRLMPYRPEQCLSPIVVPKDSAVDWYFCSTGTPMPLQQPDIAGSFLRSPCTNCFGSPGHSVSLTTYGLDLTEVTQGEFAKCVAAKVCDPPVSDYAPKERPYHPVVGVTWYQADTYCTWVSGHLPTEAQWEFAGRTSKDRTYPWGEDAPTCSYENVKGCGGAPVAVGSYPTTASTFGILDLVGNAREWVQDWADPDYIPPTINPPGPTKSPFGERVIRGSGDLVKRDARVPSVTAPDLGFRCAY